MRQLTTLICVLVLTSACGPDRRGLSTLAGPSMTVLAPALPPPSPRLSAQAPREISVGEEIDDALNFHGAAKFFELTAPSSGTLVARVSWDGQRGTLELALGDTHWAGKGVIVGKLPVVVGQKYSLSVADGAPWDYDDPFVLPFVLATSIEGETQGTSGTMDRHGPTGADQRLAVL